MSVPIYSVLCRHRGKAFLAERDLPETRQKIVRDIVSGDLEWVWRVFELNIEDCTSKDISSDIAMEVAAVAMATQEEVTRELRNFVEEHCGVGTALRAAS